MLANDHSQMELIKEYFKKHPNRNIRHPEIVDWVTAEYQKRTGKKFRDPDRAIRQLYQEGWLIKVGKGIYKRIPGYKGVNSTAPFPEKIKREIFKRDNYRCIVCGNGKWNGYEICADHITPQYKGGQNTLENGQTLCSEHNILKERYGTTDFLVKYSEKMIERSKKYKDTKVEQMFREILKILKKYLS